MYKWFFLALILVFFGLPGQGTYAQEKNIPLPPSEAKNAEINILLVRHGYSACGDIQCDLNPEGHEQAKELGRFLANIQEKGLSITAVLSSGACRTILTVTPSANDAALPVFAYFPREGLDSCNYPGNGENLVRPEKSFQPEEGVQNSFRGLQKREEIIAFINREAEMPKAIDSKVKFYLAADHSNFICKWFSQLNVPEEDYKHDCTDGNLALTDFADFYWLYDAKPGEGTEWRLVHFENAFDRGIPNAYEQ